MGNAQNPPDTKRKLMKKKVPHGKNAIGHTVKVEYEDDVDGQTRWWKGKIIMYSRKDGYCIRFDECR